MFFQRLRSKLEYEEVFVIKKGKNTVAWTYIISDLNDEEFIGVFYKRNYKNKSKRIQC